MLLDQGSVGVSGVRTGVLRISTIVAIGNCGITGQRTAGDDVTTGAGYVGVDAGKA